MNEFEKWQRAHGLTDAQAAEQLGLSKSTVKRYRRGFRTKGTPVVLPQVVQLALKASASIT